MFLFNALSLEIILPTSSTSVTGWSARVYDIWRRCWKMCVQRSFHMKLGDYSMIMYGPQVYQDGNFGEIAQMLSCTRLDLLGEW